MEAAEHKKPPATSGTTVSSVEKFVQRTLTIHVDPSTRSDQATIGPPALVGR